MAKQKRWTKILEELKRKDNISVNDLIDILEKGG